MSSRWEKVGWMMRVIRNQFVVPVIISRRPKKANGGKNEKERTMFGFGMSELIVLLVIFCGIFLPFIINANLAKSRGKSVALILFLTLIFSWIVTLILAFMPKVAEIS
jgi:isoprenylcysteine carboxyl methyltransferase (ICMT) family protein YpbQ